MKRVLVWKAKHGEYYFDASTDELLEVAACRILKRLVYEGWIWEPGDLRVTWDENVVDLTDEEIDAMPEAMQSIMRGERDRAQAARDREIRYHADDLEMWRKVSILMEGGTPTRTHSTPSGKTSEIPVNSWNILQERNGWEYEDYRLVDVQ